MSDTYDGSWEGWQRRLEERLAAIERRYDERIGAVEREVAGHTRECGVRHAEIQRRFEYADSSRTALFGKLDELRGALVTAHDQNQRAIMAVQLGQSSQWVRIAATVGSIILAAVVGYVFHGLK